MNMKLELFMNMCLERVLDENALGVGSFFGHRVIGNPYIRDE